MTRCHITDPNQFNPGQPFSDPAIMSARMASPSLGQAMPNGRFPPPGLDAFASHPMAFGPPPGLSFPEDVGGPMGNHAYNGASGPSTSMEVSQSGSTHGESGSFVPWGGSPSSVYRAAVLSVRKLYHRP